MLEQTVEIILVRKMPQLGGMLNNLVQLKRITDRGIGGNICGFNRRKQGCLCAETAGLGDFAFFCKNLILGLF